MDIPAGARHIFGKSFDGAYEALVKHEYLINELRAKMLKITEAQVIRVGIEEDTKKAKRIAKLTRNNAATMSGGRKVESNRSSRVAARSGPKRPRW